MAVPRRAVLLLLLSFLFVFLLYQLYDYQSVRPAFPNVHPITYQPPAKPNDGRFRWTDRITQHPVVNLAPLPIGKPKRLPPVQHHFGPESAADQATRIERQQKVKDAFVRCWSSYKTRAWMRDELSPISGNGRESFGGWAATLVDALDTLHIMNLKDEFEEAAAASANIDLSTSTEDQVNIFETTIRYLGGFLAAYDLSGKRVLLDKAVEVGEMLLVAFDTPNHMPITRWDWKNAKNGGQQEAASGMLVSELGSLSLEFTRLSQLTGDPRWFDAIQRITDLFDAQQGKTKLPGMWPVVVNAHDEDLTGDGGFTLGGMSDSLYEYFPKEYALLGGLAPVYQKLYEGSMTTAIQTLFFRPMVPSGADILVSGNIHVDDKTHTQTLDPQGQHLGCFTGGMLALGGRLFSNATHVDIGRKLVDGCIWAYDSFPQGVMPETFHLVPCASKESCAWDTGLWSKAVLQRSGLDPNDPTLADEEIVKKKLQAGYTDIGDPRYILRPEAIESVFILYRVTGDKTLQDAAWNMFTAIQRLTQTEYANAAIRDITAVGSDGMPPKEDRMESFWLAETLKYFYLIFSEPGLINLDDWVLNTEAHPFKRPL